ncbi:MAG: TrbC/VirB2 family protein [Thermoanaerobaculia bacterium]|nr:MAG: TrbC/VirB2 family protein [Thermoanaerobaculia bacterium]MBZ0103449.1 TrbC/VirB2 family protein [Thermoanaerobaculia bacterium]
MPEFEQILNSIIDALSGNVARALVVLGIIIAGIIWVFSGNSAGLRRLAQVILGGSLIVGAASLVSLLFPG